MCLGFTILGEIFACVTIFNPTIEVVTFHIRGMDLLITLVQLDCDTVCHKYITEVIFGNSHMHLSHRK